MDFFERKLNIAILIYNDFAFHGIGLLAYLMKQSNKCNLIYFSDDGNSVVSKEGISVNADCTINDLKLEACDALIIPGGTPSFLERVKGINPLINYFKQNNKLIAGMCASGIQLAKAGALDFIHYTNSNDLSLYIPVGAAFPEKRLVVVDKNIITARGKGFVDFTMAVLKYLEVENDERIDYLTSRYKPISMELEW